VSQKNTKEKRKKKRLVLLLGGFEIMHKRTYLAQFWLHVKEESRETFRVLPNIFWQHVEINSLNITTSRKKEKKIFIM